MSDKPIPFSRLMTFRPWLAYFVRFDGGEFSHEVVADGDSWMCFTVELIDREWRWAGLCPAFKYRGTCRHVEWVGKHHRAVLDELEGREAAQARVAA